MRPLRIMLADDHALVRAGFRAMLENLPDVTVVAEANDGREALDLIREQKPDLVFMDIAMPGLNGLDSAARIAKTYPSTRVIILSMHSTEEYVISALRAGASGYLLKDASPAELQLAVQAIARGETYLSPGVSRHVIEDYMNRTSPSGNFSFELDPASQLTPRQREVLQLIAEGNTSKEIARILHISLKTVESHRQGIMSRLDIHDLAGLVRYAVRIGLVSSD